MNIFKKIAVAAAITAFAIAPSFANDFQAGDIKVSNPTIRATLPGAKVGGGFMMLMNGGSSDDRLVGVTAADSSDDVQLHEMAIVNDVMKMRQLPDGIPLPAGEMVTLEPGGLHVMFMKIKKPFTEGEMVPATLHFEKAGDLDVQFMVGPAAGGAMKHGDGKKKNMIMGN